MPLCHQINLAGSVKLMPERFMPMLSQDIAQLKRDNDQVEQQLSLSQNLLAFKRWIKEQERE